MHFAQAVDVGEHLVYVDYFTVCLWSQKVRDTLDQKIQVYLQAIHENGGTVIKEDRKLLAEYRGPVMLKKTWAQSLLQWMGFVKRRGTTKSNVAVADFEARKEIFLSDIAAIVVLEEIPPDLIINWDHTGLNLIPS